MLPGNVKMETTVGLLKHAPAFKLQINLKNGLGLSGKTHATLNLKDQLELMG